MTAISDFPERKSNLELNAQMKVLVIDDEANFIEEIEE